MLKQADGSANKTGRYTARPSVGRIMNRTRCNAKRWVLFLATALVVIAFSGTAAIAEKKSRFSDKPVMTTAELKCSTLEGTKHILTGTRVRGKFKAADAYICAINYLLGSEDPFDGRPSSGFFLDVRRAIEFLRQAASVGFKPAVDALKFVDAGEHLCGMVVQWAEKVKPLGGRNMLIYLDLRLVAAGIKGYERVRLWPEGKRTNPDNRRDGINECEQCGYANPDDYKRQMISAAIWTRNYCENHALEKFDKAASALIQYLEPTKSTVPARSGLKATGTGFVVGNEYVLTANHVIDDCGRVSVRQYQEEIDVEKEAWDGVNDLGLLKARKSFEHTAKFRGGKSVRLGETVVNYGYPLMGVLSDAAKISKGEINSLAGIRNDSGVFQYDAETQPGNSGGPVLDLSGNVVGVVSYRYAKESNINFAVKSSVVEEFLSANNVGYEKAKSRGALELPDIAKKAERFTVFVGCWE